GWVPRSPSPSFRSGCWCNGSDVAPLPDLSAWRRETPGWNRASPVTRHRAFRNVARPGDRAPRTRGDDASPRPGSSVRAGENVEFREQRPGGLGPVHLTRLTKILLRLPCQRLGALPILPGLSVRVRKPQRRLRPLELQGAAHGEGLLQQG